MKIRNAGALVISAVVATSAMGAVTTSVVDVPSGTVVQRFLYLHPDSPVANVIVLPGGDGTLGIQNDGTMTSVPGGCTPAVRNRQAFADHGYALALVGEDSTGVVFDFNNVQAVFQYLQTHDNLPVWIIGISGSTAPAMNVAASLPSQSPVGLVVASTDPVPAALGARVTRPTLVLVNALDTGQAGPQVFATLTSAAAKEFVVLSGGNNNGCGGNGYHLFFGLDAEFVAAITGFIDKYNNTFAVNYEGLWWAAPAASESGWGINFAHQGDTIFASWFTYDLTGKGWWLVMTAPKSAPNTYSGTLYTTTGPPFNAVPFDPLQVVATAVGTGTLSFSDANNASFNYTVNGVTQTKSITHQVFGALPSCATASGSLAAAANYQDLWWASPPGSESGWGINFTHQGDTIFASWFTYDVDHTPMWLVVTAPKSAPGVYSGTLYRTTGPAFNAVPFNPNAAVPTAVGTATFTFSDGNNATFAYIVNGVSQSKAITREVFSAPGTVCQ